MLHLKDFKGVYFHNLYFGGFLIFPPIMYIDSFIKIICIIY